MHRLGVRKFADFKSLDAVEECAGRVLAVGILVAERPRLAGIVPFLAARHAGMAADAHVQVDDQRKLLLRHAAEIPITRA